jgi:hypothetical protein
MCADTRSDLHESGELVWRTDPIDPPLDLGDTTMSADDAGPALDAGDGVVLDKKRGTL